MGTHRQKEMKEFLLQSLAKFEKKKQHHEPIRRILKSEVKVMSANERDDFRIDFLSF